jgi:hypothetical protein
MDRPYIAIISKSTALKWRDAKFAKKVWEMIKLQKKDLYI